MTVAQTTRPVQQAEHAGPKNNPAGFDEFSRWLDTSERQRWMEEQAELAEFNPAGFDDVPER